MISAISCSNDDANSTEEKIVNLKGETDCQLGPSGSGVCLNGPLTVIPGETYMYAFKISKRKNGSNINKVVNWIVESGQIEVINIETTLMTEFTISVSTIKFGDDFNVGSLKASSNEYDVESDPQSSNSYITYKIVKE